MTLFPRLSSLVAVLLIGVAWSASPVWAADPPVISTPPGATLVAPQGARTTPGGAPMAMPTGMGMPGMTPRYEVQITTLPTDGGDALAKAEEAVAKNGVLGFTIVSTQATKDGVLVIQQRQRPASQDWAESLLVPTGLSDAQHDELVTLAKGEAKKLTEAMAAHRPMPQIQPGMNAAMPGAPGAAQIHALPPSAPSATPAIPVPAH